MPFRQPLKNCLKDYKGKNIKIHSQKGICFWYCDKVGKTTEQEINEINDKYISQLKKTLVNKKYRLSHLDTIYDTKIANYQKRAKTSKAIKSKLPKLIEKANTQREKERNRLPTFIMSISSQISSWNHLLERKVVDIYEGISPDELNTYIIVVRGQEKGNYWTIKEYQDRDKKIKRKLRDGVIE